MPRMDYQKFAWEFVTNGRRKVRTPEGAERFGKPIGSPIGKGTPNVPSAPPRGGDDKAVPRARTEGEKKFAAKSTARVSEALNGNVNSSDEDEAKAAKREKAAAKETLAKAIMQRDGVSRAQADRKADKLEFEHSAAKSGEDKQAWNEKVEALLGPTGERWDRPEFPKTLPEGDPLLENTFDKKTVTPIVWGERVNDKGETEEFVRGYGPEMDREEWRQAVLDKHFEGKTPPVGPPEGRKPILTFTGGGGASGKGHILKMLQKNGQLTPGAVHVDPDEIKMGEIPEFHQIKETGDSRGADRVHKESSVLGDAVVERAKAGKYDLIDDGTLGKPDSGVAKLTQAVKDGYDVHLVGVTADPDDAVLRNTSRAGKTGRYVPEEMQLNAHKGFSQGFERYMAVPGVTGELWDTNTRPDPTLLARKTSGDGDLEIMDRARYDAFMQKASLNPGAKGPNHLYD